MSEPKTVGINETNLAKLEALFRDPSIGRILVETYSNDTAEWVIPSLSEILGQASEWVYTPELWPSSRPASRPVF